MLVPILHAVRPADVLGAAARVATGLLALMLILSVMLARLPEAWAAPFGGRTIGVRVVGVLVVLWFIRWVRALVYARLPSSAYLVGRTLVVPGSPPRRRIDVASIEEISVDLRPAPIHQMFVVHLKNGEPIDLCPVHWKGAGRLYARLARKLR